jgi:hypothetical protein
MLTCLVHGGLPPLDYSRCDAFHGCISMADRLATLRAARECVSPGGASKLPCDARRLRAADNREEGAVFCGFTSRAASVWLAQLHARTRVCEVVAFTIVTNGYDGALANAPVPRAGSSASSAGAARVCYVAFVDDSSLRAMQARSTSLRVPLGVGWTFESLPDPIPFPDSPPRLAHSMKMSAMRLFPAAHFVVYVDGKLQLRVPAEVIAASVRNRTRLPYMVMEHPTQPNGPNAVPDEFEASQKRVNQTESGEMHARDTADIALQRALYESEGALNNMFGMLDSQFLAQNRHGAVGSADPSVSLKAPASRVIQWLECAWFNEVALFSHREQNSFWYAVDELGLRRQIYVLLTKSQKRINNWTRRHIKQISEFYLPNPHAHQGR